MGLGLVCKICVMSWAVALYPYFQAEPVSDLARTDTNNFLPGIRAQIQQAERDVRAHPRDAKAAGTLAMTLHAYQLYEPAARAYSLAHSLEPQNFDWLYLLGAVQIERGEFNDAVKSFRTAIQIRPDDLPARVRLAQTLALIPDLSEADRVYRGILDQYPNCAQAWYGYGRVQAAQGDRAEAVRAFAKAIELFPHYSAAHFALAGELRRMGKNTEAREHLAAYSKNQTSEPPLEDPLFQRIRELNHSVQAHLQRAVELERTGDLDGAIREQEAALASDRANVQAHVNLISLYGRTGARDRAREHFEAATALNPGRSDAWYNYGVLLFRERRYSEAGQMFRRALQINPYYAEAHNYLGLLFELERRLDEAAHEFRDAIANKPDYPLARFHLGRILANQQKYPEAIDQLERALQPEDENTPAYVYALAATYARAGDRDHALEFFQKARAAAVARGQSQLLTSIDRDLKALGVEQ